MAFGGGTVNIGEIPTDGPVAVGGSSLRAGGPTHRSINLLKNVKAATSINQPNSSINALRNWFRDNVGAQGKLKNTLLTGNGTQVNVQHWRGVVIYGMNISVRNETKNGSYWNGNNGEVRMKGIYGAGVNYRFTFNSVSKTVNVGVAAIFNGLDVGDKDGVFKTFNASMEHRTDGDTKEDFQVKLWSTATTPRTPTVLSFGTNNVSKDFPSAVTSNFTSMDLLIGKQ